MKNRPGPRALVLAAALAAACRVVSAGEAPAEPPRNIAGPGDYNLRERVIHLIGRDPDLKDEHFNVVLVNGGAVFSGTMRTCALKLKALRMASVIRGVINVTDEMTVARAGVPDEALHRAVVHSLENQAESLGLQEAQVTVEDGTVTLGGTVKTFEARQRAEEYAGAVAGVMRVSNHLKPADAPGGADDLSVRKAVAGYLGDWRGYPWPAVLEVSVKDGIVTLRGRTAFVLARQQAALMASLVKGVTRVDNFVKVDPSLYQRGGASVKEIP
jgi:osmotically-inducible protein OsmY